MVVKLENDHILFIDGIIPRSVIKEAKKNLEQDDYLFRRIMELKSNWVEELKQLTSIPALSGMEDKMVKEMVGRFKRLTDDIVVDYLGNVPTWMK